MSDDGNDVLAVGSSCLTGTMSWRVPPTPGGSAELALRYIYFRFVRTSLLEGFLRGLTELEVRPISSTEATHCTRASR